MKQLLIILVSILSINTILAQYCSSSSTSADEEWISYVRLSSFSNTSTSSSGYQDFTDAFAPINMVAGGCHNINVNVDYSGTEYPEYYGVWIDLNNDNDFSDPGEEIHKTYSPIVGGFGANFNLPSSAALGITRMRVVMKYGSLANYCGNFAYGEVEDYHVNILAAEPVCSSSGQNTTYEYINSVSLNSTTTVSGNNGGYFINNCSGASLQMGLNNTITLVPGFNGSSYPEVWKMWIDYNKNNSFEDAGELVHLSSANNGSESFNLSLPNSLMPDDMYRIRISMKYSSAAPNSCSNFFYGEVEDYLVVVQDPLGVAGSLQEEVATRARLRLNETTFTERYNISPNPASDYIQINFKYNRDIPESLTIVNMQGRIVKQLANFGKETQQKIEIDNFHEGYYLLQFIIDGDIETIPFVVIKK